ncbi:MAG: hypothetical protein JWQ50_1203 [Caballeronia mineralivorans]|jgi:hypothetical protein|nr:hypothetical protein [Caballeronia mineralivorans]
MSGWISHVKQSTAGDEVRLFNSSETDLANYLHRPSVESIDKERFLRNRLRVLQNSLTSLLNLRETTAVQCAQVLTAAS